MTKQTPEDRIANVLFSQPPETWREILYDLLSRIQKRQREIPIQDRVDIADIRRLLRDDAPPKLSPRQQTNRMYKQTP